MYSNFNENLAKLIIQYSVNVKKNDLVLIQASINAENLVREIFKESIRVGANILRMKFRFDGQDEIFYKYASDAQLQYVDELEIELWKKANVLIAIDSDYNTRELTNVAADKKVMLREARKEITKIYLERAAKKELRWNLSPYPCNAHAQEAQMGGMEYLEFVYKALNLHQEDPVSFWKGVEKKQQKIVDILNKGSEMQIIGEDTDLTLAIENRKWENCCGHENLPDGEVFTGPHEDGVNGTIRFTYPGIYEGQEIEDIHLTFKEGKVTDFNAVKGKELLEKMLTISNANIIGELAVGTNFAINKFTKNMLFDEKMGGTVHLALGSGYPETGSKNQSSIHWDILKEMKSDESIIFLDEEMIYKAGKWLIPK
ncbi:MAG: aminopeptidase [Candidatus Heimdallarchaeota archaeon]|nr:MAG: aminopeptidase [Candidatus Heimdallarchaeota archaeon]